MSAADPRIASRMRSAAGYTPGCRRRLSVQFELRPKDDRMKRLSSSVDSRLGCLFSSSKLLVSEGIFALPPVGCVCHVSNLLPAQSLSLSQIYSGDGIWDTIDRRSVRSVGPSHRIRYRFWSVPLGPLGGYQSPNVDLFYMYLSLASLSLSLLACTRTIKDPPGYIHR